jgi:hypothetical protein
MERRIWEEMYIFGQGVTGYGFELQLQRKGGRH